MYSKEKLLSLIFVLLCLLPSVALRAQDDDLTAIRNEYPLLMQRYGDRLESRTAHYIFAIDVSNSMKPFEQTVRDNLTAFVKAVPDGDQISIIVMADKDNTEFLDHIQCATLNSNIRGDIIAALRSPRFSFNRDGSDGYTMAARVLEAMNVVNSSDLTFIYLLTDFEYWTHANHYNKEREDWAALQPLLSDKHRGLLCRYGVDLSFGQMKHPEANFKPELDAIFGPLEYHAASSANLLANWFGHVINQIRANKINAMLKSDWKALCDSSSERIVRHGRTVGYVLTMPEDDLVDGYSVTAAQLSEGHFSADGGEVVPAGKTAIAGHYSYPRGFAPQTVTLPAGTADLQVHLSSRYADEITRLQSLCHVPQHSPDAIHFDRQTSLPTAKTTLWNATWPWPVWLLIALVAITLLLTYLYTWLLMHPEKRYTAITVQRRASDETKRFSGETYHWPYSLGRNGELKIPDAKWQLELSVRKHNPLWSLFGLRTAYRATLVEGSFADIIDDTYNETVTTLQTGETGTLFSLGKPRDVRLEIKEGSTLYRIAIN